MLGKTAGRWKRVLEHNSVTQQQIRRREAGYLVVREVPRHDAEQWTDRLLAHYGLVRVLGLSLIHI